MDGIKWTRGPGESMKVHGYPRRSYTIIPYQTHQTRRRVVVLSQKNKGVKQDQIGPSDVFLTHCTRELDRHYRLSVYLSVY